MLSLPALESMLRARLAQPLPGVSAHLRLAPRPRRQSWAPGVVPATAIPAAALVLLYPRGGELYVPLTLRHRTMPRHPGQISLPGGGLDEGETAEAAALREAREELGIDPAAIRVAGALSPIFVPVSNFAIHPFVATSDTRPEFRPAPREVEALVEVPLADLEEPSRLKWGQRTREGYLVDFPYFDVAGQQVWGATAMILSELLALIGPESAGNDPQTR